MLFKDASGAYIKEQIPDYTVWKSRADLSLSPSLIHSLSAAVKIKAVHVMETGLISQF